MLMLNVEHGSKRFSNFGFSFFVDRKNPGPEDRNGEEGGTAVLHEDVHGLSTLLHLPHEVCVCVCIRVFSLTHLVLTLVLQVRVATLYFYIIVIFLFSQI